MKNKIYYLMHKDHPAAKLEMDTESGIIQTASILDGKYLPLGTEGGIDPLKKWWNRRATPISQGKLRQILNEHEIATPQAFLVRCLGLSLSDHYWICPKDSGLKWDDVSLFSNNFTNADKYVGDVVPIPELDSGMVLLSPSASMHGQMRKKWVLENGRRRLLKWGQGTDQQAVNEVIATVLHDKQGCMPFTRYELCTVDSDMGPLTGCICDCFANETTEFIPAYDVVSSVKKRNDVSYYEHYIHVCELNGLSAQMVRNFMDYQTMTDFIITNTDRHLNNYGILRDSETLSFTGMAPLFDSGNSMFWTNPKAATIIDLLDIKITGLRQKETEMLRYVKNRDIVNLSKLPTRREIQNIMEAAELHDISPVLDAYEKKIMYAEQFQRGVKLRTYTPKRRSVSDKIHENMQIISRSEKKIKSATYKKRSQEL